MGKRDPRNRFSQEKDKIRNNGSTQLMRKNQAGKADQENTPINNPEGRKKQGSSKKKGQELTCPKKHVHNRKFQNTRSCRNKRERKNENLPSCEENCK